MELVVCGAKQEIEFWQQHAANANAVLHVTASEDSLPSEDADLYINYSPHSSTAAFDTIAESGRALVLCDGIMPEAAARKKKLIYFNTWPSGESGKLELACNDASVKNQADRLFSALGINLIWVPNIPGLVSPRVISAIINEAWMALKEGVSSKDDIDSAMKLGTNYPYGPFEWCERIGIERVYGLLKFLSKENSRYLPAILLEEEARKKIK